MTAWSRDRDSAIVEFSKRCETDAWLASLERLLAQRRSQSEGRGFAICFIELRRSDRVQAIAGVPAARAVGETIGARLDEILRHGDQYAFNGSDEVLLLLPEVDSAGKALAVASVLVGRLRESMRSLELETRLRPAVGYALYPVHGIDAGALIAAAERAARGARLVETGYQLADLEVGGGGTAKLSFDLEAALGANQLQVWLQPQLNLRSGLFDAAEALIRWIRPDGLPPVSPIVIVELAESQGLMPRLTEFVMKTVLRHSASFRRSGMDLRIAINVSASMLTDDTFPGLVKAQLELWDVAPDRLTLEVTENTLMQDVEHSLSILHALKEVGTHLSLDDFGTGYSSFAYLRRMPLDELKIDQLFVRTLSVLPDGSLDPQREGDLRIVRSIIDIAHNFELQTVAEGVEDEATLALLRGLGCDVIQGYHTGRPMPIPKVEAWWRERQPASGRTSP